MNPPSLNDLAAHRRRKKGFTLVELLVVITIIIVMAAIATRFAGRTIAQAQSVTAMSNLRACGVILLTNASDKNSRLSVFSGGASGGFEERAYNIVRAHLGFSQANWNNKPENLIALMHWNSKKVKPSNFHWDCYGVNFTDNPDFGVQWTIENGRADGSNGRILSIPAVTRADSYPILLDSSTATGSEIFRIGISASELPGLRNQGKANAFFLDGSAKSLNKPDLKRAGFSKAYDLSVKPPKVVAL